MSARRFFIGALLLGCASLSFAHEAPPRYNQIDLQVDVSREVQNDLMNATMYSELNEANAGQLTQKLNRIGNDAVALAKQHKAVKVRTGYNQTYPVYDRNNKLVGWRGRTEVRLEGKDFAAVSDLIGALQSTMQLGGVSFSVSPELRRDTQNELMKEVVAAFRARADILKQALGAKSYKLRSLAVNTEGGGGPRPVAMSMRAEKAADMAPSFEAGTSEIQVFASGGIEVE
ncbi:MAG TPA: SIMPL domain-containing protein [Burkholderiales bacterium]|nr:SIMPL domain-containing protein [Burkholderiales bacterium]